MNAQVFKGIVSNGKITPLEKIKLKESQRVLVTLVDSAQLSDEADFDWKKLKRWIIQQKKKKKYSSYSSVKEAVIHLKKLAHP